MLLWPKCVCRIHFLCLFWSRPPLLEVIFDFGCIYCPKRALTTREGLLHSAIFEKENKKKHQKKNKRNAPLGGYLLPLDIINTPIDLQTYTKTVKQESNYYSTSGNHLSTSFIFCILVYKNLKIIALNFYIHF